MLVRMRTGSFLGGETRRSKVIREQHPHCVSNMFSAHIFERMYGKRAYMLVSACTHYLLRSLSQTCLFSVGFCEDTTEGRTKKVKLLRRLLIPKAFVSLFSILI